MTERHIGFTGTRDIHGEGSSLALARFGLKLRRRIEYLRDAEGVDRIVFHHGDCLGFDNWIHGWVSTIEWDEVGVDAVIELHPPDDFKHRAFADSGQSNCTLVVHKPKPYMERNQDIVDAAGELWAFPRDPKREMLRSGTWATVRRARKRGIPVIMPTD